MNLKNKERKLRRILRDMGSVVVGYSGGVDSTLLARVASEELGDRVLAVIADSESLPASELREAKALARSLGFPLRAIRTRELANPRFARNPANRCYHCKNELFRKLKALAKEKGFRHVADGANQDDLGDFRPGLQAAARHRVRHPLQEAGFAKADIRDLARRLGLPNWDKPSLACLASRFPYGTELTGEKLSRVDRAEEVLRGLGFRGYRVRYHESGRDTIARIEVSADDFPRLLDPAVRLDVDRGVRGAGFTYVSLDLQPFRSGRLNDSLPRTARSPRSNS